MYLPAIFDAICQDKHVQQLDTRCKMKHVFVLVQVSIALEGAGSMPHADVIVACLQIRSASIIH
jgi:hypothetical protein